MGAMERPVKKHRGEEGSNGDGNGQAHAVEQVKMEGLNYVENFITDEEERELLEHIDRGQWLFDLKRRVQHYGYKYDYKNRSINRSMQLGALPDFLHELIDRLMARHVLSKRPDQVIINEYLPGQGICAHDKPSLFDNEIASISLGST